MFVHNISGILSGRRNQPTWPELCTSYIHCDSKSSWQPHEQSTIILILQRRERSRGTGQGHPLTGLMIDAAGTHTHMYLLPKLGPFSPQPIPSPLCHQPGQSTAYNMKGLGSKRKGGLKEKPQAFCTSYSDFLSSPSFSKITQEFHLVHTGCVKHAECLQHAWDFLMLAQEGTRASPSANSLNVLISFTVQWHHGRKRLGKRKGFVWLTLLHRSPSSVEARPCTQVGTWRQELK